MIIINIIYELHASSATGLFEDCRDGKQHQSSRGAAPDTARSINSGDLPVRSMWGLVWLKNKKLSPVAGEYLQHLRKEKAKIIKDQFDWFEQYK